MVLYDRKYERPSVITGRCENKSSPTKIHNEKHIERDILCIVASLIYKEDFSPMMRPLI